MTKKKITTRIEDDLYQQIKQLQQEYGDKRVIKKLIEKGLRKPQCIFLETYYKDQGECKLFGTVNLVDCVFCPFFTKHNERKRMKK